MSTNSLNLITLKPGDIVRMADGAHVKITQNPGDGLWVFGCRIGVGELMSGDSEVEEPLFAQEIEAMVSTESDAPK